MSQVLSSQALPDPGAIHTKPRYLRDFTRQLGVELRDLFSTRGVRWATVLFIAFLSALPAGLVLLGIASFADLDFAGQSFAALVGNPFGIVIFFLLLPFLTARVVSSAWVHREWARQYPVLARRSTIFWAKFVAVILHNLGLVVAIMLGSAVLLLPVKPLTQMSWGGQSELKEAAASLTVIFVASVYFGSLGLLLRRPLLVMAATIAPPIALAALILWSRTAAPELHSHTGLSARLFEALVSTLNPWPLLEWAIAPFTVDHWNVDMLRVAVIWLGLPTITAWLRFTRSDLA